MGKKFAIVTAGLLLGLFIAHQEVVQAKVPVERMPTRGVSISHATADAPGGKLTVAGKVSRWHQVHVPGHVDVEVYDPEGKLLSRDRARLPLQIMSKRGGRLDLPFSSTFDFAPPQGSMVRVRYHASSQCEL